MEDVNNQLLLLNAVRSAKRFPLIFTDKSKINIRDPVSAGTSFGLPVVGKVLNALVFENNVEFSSGVLMDLAPLNSDEFYKGIMTPVTPKTFKYFLDQGWHQELIYHVMVRTIEIEKSEIKKNASVNNAESETAETESKQKRKESERHYGRLLSYIKRFDVCAESNGKKVQRSNPNVDVPVENCTTNSKRDTHGSTHEELEKLMYVNIPGEPEKFEKYQKALRALLALNLDSHT
ncbi:MAG: hypothetical protein AAF387_22420, partial [Pseudomonadota bacterium]